MLFSESLWGFLDFPKYCWLLGDLMLVHLVEGGLCFCAILGDYG